MCEPISSLRLRDRHLGNTARICIPDIECVRRRSAQLAIVEARSLCHQELLPEIRDGEPTNGIHPNGWVLQPQGCAAGPAPENGKEQ
eukprot:scaffold105433_cov31-Tisochrysis_lutea.AAC.5